MLFGRNHQDQDNKTEARISSQTKVIGTGETSSRHEPSPRLVLLQQGTSHGSEMFSNNSEGRFPFSVEADALPHSKTLNTDRCSSADDVERLLDLGHDDEDDQHHDPSRLGRGRGSSRPQSRKPSEQTRSKDATANERKGKNSAVDLERQHRGHRELPGSHKPTSVYGTNTMKAGLRCYYCGRTETPQWRTGPEGPLCNVCGLVWDKRHSKRKKRSLSH